jgi:transposase-like protein
VREHRLTGSCVPRSAAGRRVPYLWLDATNLKQREDGRIVSVVAIPDMAVNTDGKREIVGLHVGPSEAETFWSGSLRSLARRGLHGVKLVISDALSRPLDVERVVVRGKDTAERGGGCAAPGVH